VTNSKAKTLVEAKDKSVLILGDIVTILLTGEETNNKYVVVEIISPAGGGVPFLHTHPASETFQVLEGTYEFYGQDEAGNKYAVAAPVGKVVHIPSRCPHGFRNVGQTDGKVWAILEPVGNMERFFEEAGIPVEDKNKPSWPEGAPDLEKYMPIFEKYEIEFIETPPG
jgi:quercetin 2,3-dioxygenase